MVVETASELWREKYTEAGVTLHEIGTPTSSSRFYWAAFPFFLVRDLRWLRRHLTGEPVTVVSSFFPMPWLTDRALANDSARRVSLCFEPFPFFHDGETLAHFGTAQRAQLSVLARLYSWVDVRGIRAADVLLTLNRVTRDEIGKVYGRDDARPIYAGVDLSVFHPFDPDDLADLRERFGAGPLVVHSTDYSPIKRTELALRAFAAAARAVPGSRLVITSTRPDGAAEARLSRLAVSLGIVDQVDFAGFLPFEDLPRLYSLATVLLQTGTAARSGATTMSLPVKEAMACGTPAVRSHTTDEDVEHGVSGFLIDPADAEGTGSALAALLSDPVRARAMGQAGRAMVARTYDWDRVAEAILEAIDE